MALRENIDARFARFGVLLARHPWVAIAFALGVAAAFLSWLPRLGIDASDEAFLHERDSVRATYDAFQAQFGRDAVILIAIESDDVFDHVFLERLRALHRDLEESVSSLADITSLHNARDTRGIGDELVVAELFEEWPVGPDALGAARARALANPLYRNLLISDDARLTTISLELDTYSALGSDPADPLLQIDTGSAAPAFLSGEERWAAARDTYEVIARHRVPGFEPHLTGGPVGEMVLMSAMQRDIALFIGVSVAVIAIILFVLFRSLVAIVLPLFAVALSLLCTLGAMALAGVKVTLPIQVLPSFLLAVGVCDAVHLLTAFYRALHAGRSRRDALAHSLEHCGLAVVMTSVTTAGGLLSFTTAELAPVMHFGIFGPIGVLFALFFTLVLLPGLLMVVPMRPGHAARGEGGPRIPRLEHILGAMGATSTQHPRKVLGFAGVLTLAALGAALMLRFSHDTIAWLPYDEPLRVATRLVDERLGGADVMEAFIETGVSNGMQDPQLLKKLDELRVYAESFERGRISVAHTVSLADVLREIHQALNDNRPESHTLPEDRRLVAQELLLFENSGSDDLEDVTDSQFSLGSFTLRAPLGDAADSVPYISAIEQHFRAVLGDEVQVTMTGDTVLTSRTFIAMIRSMASSYALALVIVTPLMMLLLGSLRGGLVSMIPNIVPIILMLGMMSLLGADLDFSTMMGGAVVLAVVVDDTIHFIYGYARQLRVSGDPTRAVQRTLETTGRALFFTSVILAASFGTWLFATMENLVHMGMFSAFAIVAAFLADVWIAPAAIVLLWRDIPATSGETAVDRGEGPRWAVR